MPFGLYFDKLEHVDPFFLMLSLPNREVVKKRTFYDQADRKRLPPHPPYSQLLVIFFCCVFFYLRL